ncbi:MAG TPA: hypothetical protein VMH01_17125 [Puia sp.]|nr:hypothetical protein [Puia sp.]
MSSTDSSESNNLNEKKLDTTKDDPQNDTVRNDSLNNYDVYQFVDDTLSQEVYINYVTPKQIKFLARTKNKITSHKCEYFGTALMANGEGTGQGSDELNNDELYGVYEYFTNKHPFFTIDVEFKRGKRLTIFSKDLKDLCARDCPLSSKGTLRRISLSKEVQHNPTW